MRMNTGCFAVAALATLAYGAQAVELVSGDGCRVVVEAYGGRLVSWQPKDAGERLQGCHSKLPH